MFSEAIFRRGNVSFVSAAYILEYVIDVVGYMSELSN